MKRLAFLLLMISSILYSQKLINKIKGDWLCVKILDSKNQPTIGKFGNSDTFIKFSFNENTYSVSDSPFDVGIPIPIRFKNENSFEWFSVNPDFAIPETRYIVKGINDKSMILATKSQSGDTINYHFLSQNNFHYADSHKNNDLGILFVKHILTKSTNYNNRVSAYLITNDSINFSPTPTFKTPEGSTFGSLFSYNIKLPNDFELDKISDEFIIDFDVTLKGACNFNIIKGLNTEINNEVIRVMEKLHKSWKPLIVYDKPICTTNRIHLYFYKTEQNSFLR